MIAKKVMKEIGEIVTSGKDETLYSAIVKMKDNDIGSVVIMDEKMDARGIVTSHDLYKAIIEFGTHALHHHLAEVMSSELVIVIEDENLTNCKTVMARNDIEHLLVRNKEDDIVGILSTHDIIRFETSREGFEPLSSIGINK